MAVRTSMAALISRVRLLINDLLPVGSGQIFADQDVQDVLDESRVDVFNLALKPKETYSGATILYLTHLAPYGNWEADFVLKQYLTIPVTASSAEVIPGVFTFAASTFPPVYLSGKTYDCYRAAADLLERWAAKWTLSYDFVSDAQSFKRSQASSMLQKLAATYRGKQRVGTLEASRGDLVGPGSMLEPKIGPAPIDYMASGNG